MRSCVLVTSWWSNCLALACLQQLRAFAPDRELLVAQAGKSAAQAERFRRMAPAGVGEIFCPAGLAGDDSSMREHLARVALREREGVWFFDHDCFLLAPAEAWFAAADAQLGGSQVCLCTRPAADGAGITQPAYWLSPRRLPADLPPFHPAPYTPRPYTLRPDLELNTAPLAVPRKDTLVAVAEALSAAGLAATYPDAGEPHAGHLLPPLPRHVHLGGLHLYTTPVEPPAGAPPGFLEQVLRTVRVFDTFFKACPPEWLAVEEPELLRRHGARVAALPAGGAGGGP